MKKASKNEYVVMILAIIFFVIGAIGFGYLVFDLTSQWQGNFVMVCRFALILIIALLGGSLGGFVVFIIFKTINYYKKNEKKA